MIRYLIRLANQGKLNPQQVKQISAEFAKIAEKFGASVRNFRISKLALEFDLFVKDAESKEQVVKALVLKQGPLLSERNLSNDEEEQRQSKQQVVQLVIKLFNEQRYWECHEVMEGIWRKENDPSERNAQQGVILAASALVHEQKNESDVCLGMIPRALVKLNQWSEPKYLGLDVISLKKSLEEMLETKRISFPTL